jgi:hydroxyacid-oxoacid transhydrogenase
VTDKNLIELSPVKKVQNSLKKAGISYDIFDSVAVEPTDISLMQAIEFSKRHQFKIFIAVGGGSVIDTAKVT